ncbi:hydroxybenzoate 3-monooxygenase [Streptomyces decoyicus]
MHNAGDASYEGAFRKQITRAEPQHLIDSPTASRLYGELSGGLL